MDKRELLDRLVSILLPHTCVLCGEVVAYEDLWCGRCEVPWRPEFCQKPSEERAYSRLIGPFWYEGGVRDAVVGLKERKDKRAAGYFAGVLASALEKARLPILRSCCILPVPQNQRNLRGRGHNPARLLAEALSAETGLPLAGDLLLRTEDSLAQHNLNTVQRAENAYRSYRRVSGAELAGERVLLVDDVCTTGSTAHACAACLRSMGAAEVVAVVVSVTKIKVEK